MTLNFIEGFLWCLLPWLTIDTASQAGFVLVIAVYAGMLGGGLATQSPVPLLFIAFATPQSISLSTKLWLLGDSSYHTLALAVFIYLTTLFGQALNSAWPRSPAGQGRRRWAATGRAGHRSMS